eukprot:TRINITY_DN71536_c0_g1_i1.p1 TRINITY_DN71536_c0_g1~~TRINITY_DN71536_c0_g1_i1.p1  ORF type:complete len:604 (+),score=132.44 TRINITY_DN71536_c0_g1_i1:99-1910(+)
MAVYYRNLRCPRLKWSKSVYPKILLALDFWLCVVAHVALVILIHQGLIELPDNRLLIAPEMVWPLLLVALLGLGALVVERWRRNEGMIRACASVGEETQQFVQELAATFGRIDDALLLRFVAAKYVLAAMHVFFFSLTSGTVPARGWSDMRANGLLDDTEMQFIANQYSGDRMALLHVWAMWAVNEAASVPEARKQLCSEALAGGVQRLSKQLRAVKTAAREASSYVSTPVPYSLQQLQETILLVTMLLCAAVAAPASSRESYFLASVAYVVLLVAVFGFREAANWLSDPLRNGAYSFPIAASVNTTNDAVVQLLTASTPAAFSPCDAWWDSNRALFSQSQVERRIAKASFAEGGANPCYWKMVEAPVAGDQASPPLLDIGCCHLDAEGCRKPQVGERVCAYQVAGRARQHGVGMLLAKVQADLDAKGKLTSSTTNPSDTASEHSLPLEHSLAASFPAQIFSSVPAAAAAPTKPPPRGSVAPVGPLESVGASGAEIVVGATSAATKAETPLRQTGGSRFSRVAPPAGLFNISPQPHHERHGDPELGGRSRDRNDSDSHGVASTFFHAACNLFPSPGDAAGVETHRSGIDSRIDAEPYHHPCQT